MKVEINAGTSGGATNHSLLWLTNENIPKLTDFGEPGIDDTLYEDERLDVLELLIVLSVRTLCSERKYKIMV